METKWEEGKVMEEGIGVRGGEGRHEKWHGNQPSGRSSKDHRCVCGCRGRGGRGTGTGGGVGTKRDGMERVAEGGREEERQRLGGREKRGSATVGTGGLAGRGAGGHRAGRRKRGKGRRRMEREREEAKEQERRGGWRDRERRDASKGESLV